MPFRTQASLTYGILNVTATTWLGMLLLVIISNAHTVKARPTPELSIHTILDFPRSNLTAGPSGEIQCYALPYGAIGIISHLLTFWTIAWIVVGRMPLWPWHKMTTYKLDMVLAFATLFTCIPIASISIHRCRLSWHFVAIGVWKLVTSVSLACTALHRCFITRREEKEKARSGVQKQGNHTELSLFSQPPQNANQPTPNTNRPSTNKGPLYWLILYLAGTITGMTGLVALVYTTFRHNQLIRHLSYVFIGLSVLLPLLTGFVFYTKHLEHPSTGLKTLWAVYKNVTGASFLTFITAFGFFSSLFSDLVLGAIADNILGLPSGDFAPLYWAWFVAKRIPLLSL